MAETTSSPMTAQTTDQDMFMHAVSDVDHDHKVGRHEFAHFIFHMAAADLVHQETDVSPEVST